MENQKELQLREHSTGLIATLTDPDKSREFERGLTVQKIIDNAVPIREVVRVTGSMRPLAQALDIALTKLVGSINVGQNLNDGQIKTIVEDLLDKYPNESLEDFILCFKKARQGEFGTIYHLHSAVIFGWMEFYLGEKYDALIRKLDKEKDELYKRPEKMPETGAGYEEFKEWAKTLTIEKTVRPMTTEEILQEGQAEPPKRKGSSYQQLPPEEIKRRELHLQYIKENYDPRTADKLPTWIEESEWLKQQTI